MIIMENTKNWKETNFCKMVEQKTDGWFSLNEQGELYCKFNNKIVYGYRWQDVWKYRVMYKGKQVSLFRKKCDYNDRIKYCFTLSWNEWQAMKSSEKRVLIEEYYKKER